MQGTQVVRDLIGRIYWRRVASLKAGLQKEVRKMAGCKRREQKMDLKLKDVLGGKSTRTVQAHIIQCSDADGIIVNTKSGKYEDQRVVIENYKGKLKVHLWASKDAVKRQDDPDYSIDLE